MRGEIGQGCETLGAGVFRRQAEMLRFGMKSRDADDTGGRSLPERRWRPWRRRGQAHLPSRGCGQRRRLLPDLRRSGAPSHRRLPASPSRPPTLPPCSVTSAPWSPSVEHVLAALSGLGVDNVEIEIDGPEVPILDGSAAPRGRRHRQRWPRSSLPARRKYLKVLKPVRVENGASFGELLPYDAGFRLEGGDRVRSRHHRPPAFSPEISTPPSSARIWRRPAPSAS